ncbi:MAG: hypothetical protein LBE56_12575 [Tannerella sp.]|jgi:hypothetical protein|nr:hypothetical protein [Tannerella sp.]
MSNSEFENGFNILYNNILSGQSPGINSYEKSFFLTKAQEEIVKNYFNPLGNKYQDGVEGSPKRNIDFSSIIRERSITGSFIPFGRIYDNMLVYELPEDYFLELSLRLRSVPQQGQQLLHRVIKNVTSMEMDRLQSKPYREPFRAQA